MNKNTLIAIIGLAIILIAGLWFIFSNSAGDYVAIVNGEKISQEDFEIAQTRLATVQSIDLETIDEATRAQIKGQVVNNLISQALLEQAAKKADIKVSDEEVEAQLTAIKAPFETQEAFEEVIAKEGLNEKLLTEQIRSGLIVQAYLEKTLTLSAITVTDEEILKTYNKAATNGEVPPLAEVKEQVRASIVNQKEQVLIGKHLKQLRTEADIEVNV